MNSKIKVKHPIGMLWKIPEQHLQKLRNDGKLKSNVTAIAGTDVEYYVDLFPNGDTDEHRGYTWIFFQLYFKGKKEIEAELTVSGGVASQFSETLSYVYKTAEGFGYPMCTVDEFFDAENGYIVNGHMKITVDGFLMLEKDVPAQPWKSPDASDSLCINLWNQDNKDFTIVAEGKEISAHKCVLAARSPVFQAMFQPHTREAQESKVIIPDFPFNVVETAVKLCYHHSLVQDVSLEDQLLLLQFFDKYYIATIKGNFEKGLISQVNESNVCLLTNCSIISNAQKLKTKCADYLEECIRQRKPVTDFDSLDRDFAFALLKNAFYQISTLSPEIQFVKPSAYFTKF